MRFVLLLLSVLCGSYLQAQCPGGICPVPQRVARTVQPSQVYESVSYPSQQVWTSQQPYQSPQIYSPRYTQPSTVRRQVISHQPRPGHWTYPSRPTIEEHMALDHGVDISGLSSEDLKTWHDAIHERTPVSVNWVQSQPKAIITRSVVIEKPRTAFSSGCPVAIPINW